MNSGSGEIERSILEKDALAKGFRRRLRLYHFHSIVGIFEELPVRSPCCFTEAEFFGRWRINQHGSRKERVDLCCDGFRVHGEASAHDDWRALFPEGRRRQCPAESGAGKFARERFR